MAKVPDNPKEIFGEITDDYKGLYGDDLISIMLYGSATGKNYRPGKSDINFMIVLSENGIENLDKAFKTITKWQKRKVAIPLFLTRRYVETSMDVFPLEYINFKHNHLLIYGEDILKDLSFNTKDVRLQCEREIKGKLLVLRETFLESKGNATVLKDIISQSISAFLAFFAALLFLKGLEAPEDKRELINTTSSSFGTDRNLFEKLLDIKERKIKPGNVDMMETYKQYLKEIRKLSKIVDELGG